MHAVPEVVFAKVYIVCSCLWVLKVLGFFCGCLWVVEVFTQSYGCIELFKENINKLTVLGLSVAFILTNCIELFKENML